MDSFAGEDDVVDTLGSLLRERRITGGGLGEHGSEVPSQELGFVKRGGPGVNSVDERGNPVRTRSRRFAYRKKDLASVMRSLISSSLLRRREALARDFARRSLTEVNEQR